MVEFKAQAVLIRVDAVAEWAKDDGTLIFPHEKRFSFYAKYGAFAANTTVFAIVPDAAPWGI
ncbi:MAG: hypothetical protein KBT59_04255 [Sphingomonadales bacterium]|nr:hypothetical protein [Sphingomonadales bacterium]|tara:strand:+ start:503 stop:688 length:186 start_codon:yes stop_codon:yes gene_type:complete